MPSLNIKHSKSSHAQKIKLGKSKRSPGGSEITETRYIMVHTLTGQITGHEENAHLLHGGYKLIKTVKYHFVKGENVLLSKTMPNIILIGKTDIISANFDCQILIRKITTLISELNAKIDLLCFPSREYTHENRQKFSKTVRLLINHFKKYYKTSTFDDLQARLSQLTQREAFLPILQLTRSKYLTNNEENISNILNILQQKSLILNKGAQFSPDVVKINSFYLIMGYLSHQLKTDKLLLNGHIPVEIVGIKIYDSEERCLMNNNFSDIQPFTLKENTDHQKEIFIDQSDIIHNETSLKNDLHNIEEDVDRSDVSSHDKECLESLDSPLISELRSFKGIKDFKTCKIPSNYSFKSRKNKFEKLGKFCTLLICSEREIVQKEFRFAAGVVDGRTCLLNLSFGETQIIRRNILPSNLSDEERIPFIKKCTDLNFISDQKYLGSRMAQQALPFSKGLIDCFIEVGPTRYHVVPFFTRQSNNSVHKIASLYDVLEGGLYVCTVKVPFESFSGTISILFKTIDSEIKISSSLFNYNNRTFLEERKVTGTPFKSFNNFVKIRNMFDSRDEVLYFSHLRLYSRDEKKKREKVKNILDSNLMELTQKHKGLGLKRDLRKELKKDSKPSLKNTLPYSRINTGTIIGPVGLNGCFKAEFVRPVRMGTQIWISVYRFIDILTDERETTK